MDSGHGFYEQKIVYARASLWPPFYTVGMVARIEGAVPTALVENALHKLRVLHPPLASRIRLEADGSAWFTTAGVGEFLLEVRAKATDRDWVELVLEQERKPFPFERGPLARFYLLRGASSSDLVVIAPHVVCDGYSMTYAMADAVALLNDPDRAVAAPPLPPAVSWATVAHSPFDNLHLRVLARIANRWWPMERAHLHQTEYEAAHQQFWAQRHNGLLPFALTPDETAAFAARCRQHGVSMAGALVAAILLAHDDVLSLQRSVVREVAVALNIRDRVRPSPGRALGIYASVMPIKLRAKLGTPYWALATQAHELIHKTIKHRATVLKPLVLDELDPTIIDGLVNALSTGQWGRGSGLLTRFVQVKGDVRSLNLSNIGRLELPDLGAPYRLQTLLPFPPVFPGTELILNVLTVHGQMNACLRYLREEVSDAAAAQVKERTLHYMFEA